MNNRKTKPYIVAGILTILFVVEIFWLSDILGKHFGLWGTVMHEVVLALIAVLVFVICKGKLKIIFPFKKPQLAKIAGTIVLWMGAYLGTMILTLIFAYFFPEQVMGASQDIQEVVMEVPVIVSLLVIALTPAICEEIAFRGALLSCFRGMKNKWGGILIVSVIFGACHGSIWRMIPTMVLGIAMGYLLFETENMVYNMLFHFINNAVPVLLLAALKGVLDLIGISDMAGVDVTGGNAEMPFATVSMYLMYAGVAPFLIYIGNYLIHKGQPGYDNGLFPREKRKTMIILISVALGMMVIGMLLTGFSVIFDPNFYLY